MIVFEMFVHYNEYLFMNMFVDVSIAMSSLLRHVAAFCRVWRKNPRSIRLSHITNQPAAGFHDYNPPSDLLQGLIMTTLGAQSALSSTVPRTFKISSKVPNRLLEAPWRFLGVSLEN